MTNNRKEAKKEKQRRLREQDRKWNYIIIVISLITAIGIYYNINSIIGALSFAISFVIIYNIIERAKEKDRNKIKEQE